MKAPEWAAHPGAFDPMGDLRPARPAKARRRAEAAAPAPAPAKPAPQVITEFPRGDHHRNRPKSMERTAVERAFATAALQDESLTATQVAERAGVTEKMARSVIDRLLVARLLHKSGRRGDGYRWGDAPVDRPAPAKEVTRYQPPPGNYDGSDLRGGSGRPGAMDAYNRPSLVDGQQVPRRKPIILGSGAQDGVKGGR